MNPLQKRLDEVAKNIFEKIVLPYKDILKKQEKDDTKKDDSKDKVDEDGDITMSDMGPPSTSSSSSSSSSSKKPVDPTAEQVVEEKKKLLIISVVAAGLLIYGFQPPNFPPLENMMQIVNVIYRATVFIKNVYKYVDPNTGGVDLVRDCKSAMENMTRINISRWTKLGDNPTYPA